MQNPSSMFINIFIFAAFLGVMYFLMIRPQSKRKKLEEDMRSSVKVGDEITTIGGIVGRIVSVKDAGESFIVETGTDRCKIKFKKWAIATIETQGEQPQK